MVTSHQEAPNGQQTSMAGAHYRELLRLAPCEGLADAIELVETVGHQCRLRELAPEAPCDHQRQVLVSHFVARPRTLPAARVVLDAVQRALAPLEGQCLFGSRRTNEWPPAPGSLRRQLARAQANAVRTIAAGRSVAAAKRMQLERWARPLAICDECGLVFPDSTSTRGPTPFRSCCDSCRPKSLERRAADGERRARAFEQDRQELAPGIWS
jgi:hypothetical protein